MRFTPRLTRADFYLLRLMMPRMGVALAITLAALLIERMLRLFDLITGTGAGIGPAFGMALSLLPHYVGLALPAAFCIGILTVLSSLSQSNEIDALENAGWSLRRIGLPFILSAVILAILSTVLFGVIQPYSRYAYYEIRHSVLNASWDGRVEQGVFIEAGPDLTISAAEIDPTGRRLDRVFALTRDDGQELAITARRGFVVPDPDAGVVRLLLRDGIALTENGGRLDFDDLTLSRTFSLEDNPFRPRGGSERELTFGELMTRASGEDGMPPEPRYAAELHSRLVRAASLIGLALLSVPLGVARKRSPVWPRIAIAVAVLAAYDHLIKFVEGLADLGRIDPALGLWGLCAAFTALGGALYLLTPGQGALSPFRLLLRWIEFLGLDLARVLRRVTGRGGT